MPTDGPTERKLADLLQFYRDNVADFEAPTYKEARARTDLIDPLFELLGWDVRNKDRFAEAYRDVVIEDVVEVGGRTKAPDYCFRIGQTPKFFVEAKKPATPIRDNSDAAYQLRRYAWSANLPLSILTNFRELAVYDGRVRPKLSDGAPVARLLYVTSEEYTTRWEELEAIFSKTAILKGSFDRYSKSASQKRGTEAVDGAFLEQMEDWRRELARVIALRNADLNSRDLNYSVQAIIDRTLFLRICEESDIEPYGRLKTLLKVKGIYSRLVEFFRLADDRYNSGLFHFNEERGRAGFPDVVSPNLEIDDEPLRQIIEGLYFPASPYEFSVVPAEILGQVYERFLGSVIRLTSGHQAKVEAKPEVREAGGVFYTPKFIVEAIVRETLGPKVEGKSPAGLEDLKILDPACGSGSFLLGAYKFLLDWYLAYYLRTGVRKNKAMLAQGKNSSWHLSGEERKRILLTHIFGVDIDSQAVEVTKLSLLLEVLRDETKENIERTQKLFHVRALPALESNVRCGNSLLSSSDASSRLLDDELRDRVNPFDYEREFPGVFGRSDPGFDVVMGNPPYVRVQALNRWAPQEVDLIRSRYVTGQTGNYDLYVVFVERALELIRSTGTLGFIIPNKFTHVDYAAPLRSALAERRAPWKLVHFGTQQVFDNATTYTCLLYAGRSPSTKLSLSRVTDLSAWERTGESLSSEFEWKSLGAGAWNLESGDDSELLDRLRSCSLRLGTFCEKIFQGVATSKDSVYLLELVEEGTDRCRVKSKAIGEEFELEREMLRPILKGAEIKRWSRPSYQHLVLFPYKVEGRRATPIPIGRIASDFPLTHAYLERNKGLLLTRSKTNESNWWLYPYPKNLGLYGCPKILSQVLSQSGAFTFDANGEFCFVGGGTAGGNAILVRGDDETTAMALLAILNSPITSFFVTRVGSAFRGGFHAFGKASIENLPLPSALMTVEGRQSLAETAREVVRLVGLRRTRLAPSTREALERDIQLAQQSNWRSVSKMYGLTENEAALLETDAKAS